MRGKLKKLFHKLFSNKKALLFSLGLVLFLSLAPLQSARAENPLSALVGFFTNIWAGMTFGLPLAIITGVLYVGAFGALVVSALLSSILKSIIEASLNISVLPGGPYNVVNVGWQFSQGLVNILFILILAFIGLATILRLQTYQMQKTLPSLIIIAILVNFSGVLVGFVVDIANLFTHFFISPIGGWNLFADGAAGLGKDFANSFVGLGANVFATGSIFIPAIKAAAFLFYFLSLSLAFLATMLLFIVRVGVLWILTILAPLAFASYILPSTKKFWTQWWQQLIQWSIIGIPMALFLYLSQLAVGSIQILPIVNFNGPSDLASSNLALASTIGSLTGPIIALLFIVVGMMISVQMAPAGAKSIMQWGGKKGLKWLAKRRPVQLALGAAAGGAAKLLSEGVKGGPHWFEQGKWKNTLGGKVGGAPLRWLSRQGENLAVPRLTQYAAKQRKFAMPTGWEQMDTQEKERNVSSTGIREDRLVKASKMKDEGSFQKTSGEFRATIIEDTKKFLKTNRDGTYEVDPHYKKEVEDIYDALPDEITENMKIGIETSGLSEDERRKKTNGYNDSKGNRVEGIKEKISNIAKDYSITRNEAAGILHAKGFKPKSIPGVAKQSVVSKPFQLAMRWMGSSHIQSLKENFAGETVRDCLKEGKGLNTIINRSEYDEIKSKNPTLAEWSKNTPAGKETLNWFDTFEKPELDKEERRKQDEIERKEKVKEGAAEAKAKAEKSAEEARRKTAEDKETEKSAEEARRKASEEAKIRRGIEMEIREKRDEVDRLRKIPLPTAPPKTMPRERTERIRQLEKEIEELHRKI